MKDLSNLFLKLSVKVLVMPIAFIVGWLALGGIYGLMQSFFSLEVVELIRQGSIKVLHFLYKLRDKFKDRV